MSDATWPPMQPMESAPRDGTEVLAWCNGKQRHPLPPCLPGYIIIRWDGEEWRGTELGSSDHEFDGWWPLPKVEG